MLNRLTFYAKNVTTQIEKNQFGKWFAEIIEPTGLKKNKIAQEAGIRDVSLSRILSGEHGVKKETAQNLIAAVNKLAGRIIADMEEGMRLVMDIPKENQPSDNYEIISGINLFIDSAILIDEIRREKLIEAIRMTTLGAIFQTKETAPEDGFSIEKLLPEANPENQLKGKTKS